METLNIRYPNIFTINKCPIEGCQEKESFAHMWKCKAYSKEADDIRFTFKTNTKRRIEALIKNRHPEKEKESNRDLTKPIRDILKKHVDDPSLENWTELTKGLIPLELTKLISKLTKSEKTPTEIITEELTLVIKGFAGRILPRETRHSKSLQKKKI